MDHCVAKHQTSFLKKIFTHKIQYYIQVKHNSSGKKKLTWPSVFKIIIKCQPYMFPAQSPYLKRNQSYVIQVLLTKIRKRENADKA